MVIGKSGPGWSGSAARAGAQGEVARDEERGAALAGEEAEAAGVGARLGVEIDEDDDGEIEALARVDGGEADGVVVGREDGGLGLVGLVVDAAIEPADEARERAAAAPRDRHQPIDVADARLGAGSAARTRSRSKAVTAARMASAGARRSAVRWSSAKRARNASRRARSSGSSAEDRRARLRGARDPVRASGS